MPSAFILMTIEPGKEKNVLDALHKMDSVEEAHMVLGSYDIIARVSAEDDRAIKEVVVPQIMKIKGVSAQALPLVVEEEVKVLEDLSDRLKDIVGDAGTLRPMMGGYEILIEEPEDFPWTEILNVLLDFSFGIWISREEKRLLIQSKPYV